MFIDVYREVSLPYTSMFVNARAHQGPSRQCRMRVMSYTPDPRVDAYIDALPGWQQDICRQVRDLVHAGGWHRSKGHR
jgi:hypothetical protein